MNMMAHTGFTPMTVQARRIVAETVHGPGMSGAAQNFSLLRAIATARLLQNPVTRRMQVQSSTTASAREYGINTHHNHTQCVMHIINGENLAGTCGPIQVSRQIPAEAQAEPGSSTIVTASFAPSSWFGNTSESPVYHGVSNKFQTLAVNRHHHDANIGLSALDKLPTNELRRVQRQI